MKVSHAREILDNESWVRIMAVMRGEYTYKLLQAINRKSDIDLDALSDLFVSSFFDEGDMDRRVRSEYESIDPRRVVCRFHALVRYLEQDGLIEREEADEGVVWITITGRGREKLETLKEVIAESLPPPRYESPHALARSTIVAFSIPEKERRKRDWLRTALRNMGLELVQNVWMGEVALPKKFLSDIRDLGLTEFINIFQVGSKGSLEKII